MSTLVETASNASAPVCGACGAPMPDGSSQCERCGATRGAGNQCPFCKAITTPQPHPQLRFACPACGGPRVPVRSTQAAPSKELVGHLGKARSARASEVTWKVAAGASAGFGLLALLLLVGIAMIASPPAFSVAAAGLVTAMPFLFAALGWRNAGKRVREREAELDAAWLEAARTLARTRPTLTAADLVDALGIDDAQARALAARLGAASDVTTDVTDSGDLAMSIRVPERLRIEEQPARAAGGEPVEEAATSVEERSGKARS